MSDTAGLLWASDAHLSGRPEDVRALARQLEAYGEELAACRRRLASVLGSLAGWRGDAADACTDSLTGDRRALAADQAACESAAGALVAYARRLEDAQVEAAHARALWRAADADTAAWGARASLLAGADASVVAAADDPGAQRRGWARGVLDSAHAQQETAARVAATELAAATEVLRRRAGRRSLEELVRFVGRDARQGFTAGGGDLLEQGRAAFDVPLDPVGAAQRAASGLLWRLQHPLRAASERLGWHDLTHGHPVRAVSRAVPSLALSYLTRSAAEWLIDPGPGRGDGDGDGSLWALPRRPEPGPVSHLGGPAAVGTRAVLIARGRPDLARQVAESLSYPTLWTPVGRGRTVYWDESQTLLVVTDPAHPRGGTVSRPADGVAAYWRRVGRYLREPG